MDLPDKIYNVSIGQFSVARHYGGCTFNGAFYVYNPKDDTLTKQQKKKRQKKAKPDHVLVTTDVEVGA